MNRLDFFRTLGLSTTGLIIPNTIWSQKPVKIYDNYIKGLTHYDFKNSSTQLAVGTELTLKRELTNDYDSFAVEVYFKSYKLGYLAAYENIAIANMLEQGVGFTAFVSKISSNPDHVYDALAVEIYTHIVINTPTTIQTDLLTKRADEANDIYRKGFEI